MTNFSKMLVCIVLDSVPCYSALSLFVELEGRSAVTPRNF